jgi:hypothetical protein
MRRFREPVGTGSELAADRSRQPVSGGGLYRAPEPVPTVQPKEDQQRYKPKGEFIMTATPEEWEEMTEEQANEDGVFD